FWFIFDGTNFTEFSESGPSVVLPASAKGRRITCDVRLENSGGYEYLEESASSSLGPVTAAPTPPGPTPDTKKPSVKVQKIRCKHRKCSFTIKATDASGIK